MGNGIRPGGGGDFDQPLGDEGPRDGGAEQIGAFIKCIGAEHGEHEIAHKFLAHILNVDLLDPHKLGLLARGFQFLALA